MSKSKNVPAVVAAQGPVATIVLTGVAANFKPGTARAEWFALVAQYDGQPLSAFVAAGTANPPTLPTKGKATGKLESVPGWARWFGKQGLLEIVNR